MKSDRKDDSYRERQEAKSGCRMFLVIVLMGLVAWGVSTNPEVTRQVFDALGDLFSFLFGD